MSNDDTTPIIKAVLDLAPPPDGALRMVVVQSHMDLRQWNQMMQSFRNAWETAGCDFHNKVILVLVEPGEDISTRLVDAVTGRALPTERVQGGSGEAWPYSKLKEYLDASGHKLSPIELPEPVGFKVEPRGEVSTQLVDAVTWLPRKESSD